MGCARTGTFGKVAVTQAKFETLPANDEASHKVGWAAGLLQPLAEICWAVGPASTQ